MPERGQVRDAQPHRLLVGDAEPVGGQLVAVPDELHVGHRGEEPPAFARHLDAGN
jgi:hypothetical protein